MAVVALVDLAAAQLAQAAAVMLLTQMETLILAAAVLVTAVDKMAVTAGQV
jgi:hypothetical protein